MRIWRGCANFWLRLTLIPLSARMVLCSYTSVRPYIVLVKRHILNVKNKSFKQSKSTCMGKGFGNFLEHRGNVKRNVLSISNLLTIRRGGQNQVWSEVEEHAFICRTFIKFNSTLCWILKHVFHKDFQMKWNPSLKS